MKGIFDMEFQRIIRNLRIENGYTQEALAIKLNVSKATIAMWETGKRLPSPEKYEEIADFFNVDIDYLYGRTATKRQYTFNTRVPDLSKISNLITPSAYRIPIVGNICAGDGCFVIEEKLGYFTIDHTIKADFALVVQGDSMIDIDINDGDIVLIKKVYDYFDGKIYAIRLIDENEATIKKCYFEKDKVIMQPCNPEYKPMIADGENVSVVGECVGVYHSL